jgi:hypothetical protein
MLSSIAPSYVFNQRCGYLFFNDGLATYNHFQHQIQLKERVTLEV